MLLLLLLLPLWRRMWMGWWARIVFSESRDLWSVHHIDVVIHIITRFARVLMLSVWCVRDPGGRSESVVRGALRHVYPHW